MKRALLCLLLSSGCAAPHRSAVCRHVHREFCGRADGLQSEDIYLDKEGGGGFFLLTDPVISSLAATHANQAALGGGSFFLGGPMSLKVDPQASAVIAAGGTAVGNMVGAIGKAAIGKP